MLDSGTLGSRLGVGTCTPLRIKALYNTTIIRVDGAPDATRLVEGAGANLLDYQGRIVEVRETQPGRPNILDYALFAGAGSIAKH
jgi:hypothetical protein